MATNLVQSRGIYQHLPVVSLEKKGFTAIITGANGISGFHTMRVLLSSPSRWKKIYAFSRRPPPPEMLALIPKDHRTRVEHIACDFLESPENIANVLAKHRIQYIDYVFFYSYLQPRADRSSGLWANAEALLEANATLLGNFTAALQLSSLTPERFVLQTGAKHYGVHLGTVLQPAVESDPRVDLEPNFYYAQEDILHRYCTDVGTSFNIVRPSWMVGATTNAQNNVFHAIGVYAAVQARRKKPLLYPGTLASWNDVQGLSSAMLTGFFSEWVALEQSTEDEAFNVSDGGSFTWARFWPELARWFGIPAHQAKAPTEDNVSKRYSILEHPGDPPVGYGPNAVYRCSFTITDWAQDPKNRAAWKDMMARHSLIYDPFEDIDALFPFADAALWGSPGRINVSTNKARMFGWTGFVDTNQAAFKALEEMGKIGILPPMVKGAEPVGYV